MWTTETPEAEVSGKKFIEGVKKRVPLVIGKEKILRNARAARLAKLTENMTDVTIRSPSGIILGEGGQIKIDSKKFSDFYSDIAKGLFVAASGSHKDWSEYTIHQQFDSFTYGKHWNKDTYLLPFQHSDFREEWDRHLIFSGFVRTFPSGVSASMWSVAIYNEQLGIVVFRTKTD
ncbi:hypothetical protein KY385_01065 [Candidatus Parcubacteria bacterium]|nr:hypothetical protein [Candidatus Parcubacteria bacterium]